MARNALRHRHGATARPGRKHHICQPMLSKYKLQRGNSHRTTYECFARLVRPTQKDALPFLRSCRWRVVATNAYTSGANLKVARCDQIEYYDGV